MRGWRGVVVACVAAGVVGVALLVPLPAAWSGAWQGRLLDLGHVPLFAALFLALRACSGRPFAALLVTLAVAGLAELAQAATGRSATWGDFLRGAVGALAAAACVRAWEARRADARLGLALAAAGLLAWPLLDCGPHLLDAWEGRRAFPTLAEFRTRRELLRWELSQATLSPSGRLEFLPGPEVYPSATLRPVARDFRGYDRLCCSFSVEGGALEVVISVRSGAPGKGETTHFQVERVYGPGRHLARVDLAELAPRAEPWPLDLSDVRNVQLFVGRPAEVRAIRLHRIWLER